jgi:hypothetical protein
VAAAVPSLAASLHASPRLSVSGHRVVLSGQATGVPTGSIVQLYRSAYPYRAAVPVQTTVTQADGSFTFAVFPDRDTRYLVTLAGGAVRALVQVHVTGRSLTKVKALSLGRARVTVVVFHPQDLRWGDAPTSWWFASGYRGAFRRAPGTRTVKLSPHATVLSTMVALPAGHFRWRACFSAPGDHALENPRRPPGCTGRGYHAGGYLPVVKAMLLVAYLRRLDAMGQHFVDSFSNSFLSPMIHVSDNSAATQCWSIVGNAGLYSVAAAAGMTNFSVTTDWGSAMFSAADQARFFFEMDSLVPGEFVGYAGHLLSTIAAYESWGIPAIARPLGYTVFFLVHQIARLECNHHTFSMAVMTDGDPDMGYGIDTIQGVTQELLG